VSLQEFFVDITGSSAGLIRAAGEGEAAAGSLESRLGGVSSGMGSIGSAASTHIGGTAVKNVSLLDRAFGGVINSVKGVIGSVVSMVGQTAGIGALFGGAAGLGYGVKLAQQYNEQMALIAATYRNVGAAVPTAAISTMQAKMTALGFTEDASNAALLGLAQAHIPVNQQMAVMSTAADLARAKSISLASAEDLLLKAAQGTGRGLQDLGINLPIVVPKAAALASATAALQKAQDAYNLALDKYGEFNAKTVTAHEKLAAATQKVSTDTAAMNDHFSNLGSTLAVVNTRVAGSAQAFAKADPLATMGASLQAIARTAGEALLPSLDSLAGWVQKNEPAIASFATNALDVMGSAAKAAGGFIANDLYPPVHDVIQFVIDHKTVFETFAGTLTALWAGAKIKTAAGSVLGDLKSLLSGNVASNLLHAITGIGGSSSGGGLAGTVSSAAGQRVFVTNWEMMAGGGAGGTAATAAEGAAGGGLLSDLGSMIAPAAIVATVAAAGSWVVNKMGGDFGKSTSLFDFLPIIGPEMLNLQRATNAQIDAAKANAAQTTSATSTAAQDMHDLHAAQTGAIQAAQNMAANERTAAGLIAGIGADARAVGTSLALNSIGQITKQARMGFAGGGILMEHVVGVGTQTGTTYDFAESGPERFSPLSGAGASYGGRGSAGGGVSVAGDVIIYISGAMDPTATALAVRDELLTLKRRGAIGTVFP